MSLFQGGLFDIVGGEIGEGKSLQKTSMLEIILRHAFAKCQNRCQPCQLGVNLGGFGPKRCWIENDVGLKLHDYREFGATVEHDDVSLNRHHALVVCCRVIF